jgi:Zn-dependent peptidase ImmA (M78 family)
MLPIGRQAPDIDRMPEVPVNGKVLQWARAIRGLKIDDAADLLAIAPDELREYESGARKPLVGLLRLMSSKYQVNFTSLLMPEPLPIEKPPTDHRTRADAKPLTIGTFLAIEEVAEALDAFDDIASELPHVIPTLKIGEARLEEDPEEVAARERKKFAVSIDEQRQWRSLARARIEWRKRIERRGVFTYMLPMPEDELSGFSLLRNGLGAICVNDNETTDGAKIFTLFHEYCHLLIRQTGISDENDSSRIERYCNRFAAGFLIPKNPLLGSVRNISLPYEFSDVDVKKLSEEYRVSNRAMALRLESLELAPKGFYRRRTGPWDLPHPPQLLAENAQPDYIRMRLRKIGNLHAETILDAVTHNAINSFDASELLGIKYSSFGKLREALG